MAEWLRHLLLVLFQATLVIVAALAWELAEDAREQGGTWMDSILMRTLSLTFAGAAFWWWHAL